MELFKFVMYADFECILKPCMQEGTQGTHAEAEHIPSGFCLYTVSRDPEYQRSPILYSGPDCIEEYFDALLLEQRRIYRILRKKLSNAFAGTCRTTKIRRVSYMPEMSACLHEKELQGPT